MANMVQQLLSGQSFAGRRENPHDKMMKVIPKVQLQAQPKLTGRVPQANVKDLETGYVSERV